MTCTTTSGQSRPSSSRKAFQANDDEEKQVLEAIGNNARQAMGMLRETIWAIRNEQF
ncbi:MAG: hypothetical protein K9J37_13425 [Saprospiraceae bacterium]|nr:hypothetical protein [Saprospiraceae bacterium]MCF8250909.1 hypothetical protein [Saprospiraceae bacterium]MCF8311874.1 hypothetical protein [Saprospiraceae bacterium]